MAKRIWDRSQVGAFCGRCLEQGKETVKAKYGILVLCRRCDEQAIEAMSGSGKLGKTDG